MSIETHELLEALKENTVALTRNSFSIERLAEKAAEQIEASTKMHDILLARDPIFDRIEDRLEEGDRARGLAIVSINEHTSQKVLDATRSLTWVVVVGTIIISLSTIFDGAGTRWLTLHGFLTPHSSEGSK